MHVVLIHGMGRSPLALALLARRLHAAGHTTSTFGYWVTRQSLDAITDGLVHHVQQHVGITTAFAVVGHSLGNVIARLASPRLPHLQRHAMLAPPNRSPRLARALRDVGLYRGLTRDAGQKLASAAFFADLPLPDIPLLIVAGTRGPRGRHSPFGDDVSDTVVALDETRLLQPPPSHVPVYVDVPSIHTWIMNHPAAVDAVIGFLRP